MRAWILGGNRIRNFFCMPDIDYSHHWYEIIIKTKSQKFLKGGSGLRSHTELRFDQILA